MMEIPKFWLDTLSPLCDGDFAIAHYVLEDEYYANFYRRQSELGRLVILDNGFHELGHPLSVPELVAAADRIKPSVVIAPDRLGDYRFGLDAFEELRHVLPAEYGVGAVLTGVSPAERAEFFMKTMKHCKMLCLPFREPRFEWFSDLLLKIPKYIQWPPRIHLLGVNELWELQAFRNLFDEMGIESKRTSVDTSKAIKFGVAGKRINEKLQLRGLGKLGDVEKKAASTHLADVTYNIAYLRKFL
jgi:hypothetical protein